MVPPFVYWTCARCAHKHTSPRNPTYATSCSMCGAYYPPVGIRPLFPATPLPVYRSIRAYRDVWSRWETHALFAMHERIHPSHATMVHAAMVPGASPHARYPGGYLYMCVQGVSVFIFASELNVAVKRCESHADAVGLFHDLLELAPFHLDEVADAWAFAWAEVSHVR